MQIRLKLQNAGTLFFYIVVDSAYHIVAVVVTGEILTESISERDEIGRVMLLKGKGVVKRWRTQDQSLTDVRAGGETKRERLPSTTLRAAGGCWWWMFYVRAFADSFGESLAMRKLRSSKTNFPRQSFEFIYIRSSSSHGEPYTYIYYEYI